MTFSCEEIVARFKSCPQATYIDVTQRYINGEDSGDRSITITNTTEIDEPLRVRLRYSHKGQYVSVIGYRYTPDEQWVHDPLMFPQPFIKPIEDGIAEIEAIFELFA